MSSDPKPAGLINSFALVNYIPDPLGRFLDDLRREVVPECHPHAHVTLMPPRPLLDSAEVAVRQIRSRMEHHPGFMLELAAVSVFPVTNVIYLEIGAGRQFLLDLHGELNHNALSYREPFPYHPHITIAQEIPPTRVEEAADLVRRRWQEFSFDRSFAVDQFTFVQATDRSTWVDLAACHLTARIYAGKR
jgi:2'-5' RNA ligase